MTYLHDTTPPGSPSTEVPDICRAWLLQANNGDELRAALVEAWLENDLLRQRARTSISLAEHKRINAALAETVARYQRPGRRT